MERTESFKNVEFVFSETQDFKGCTLLNGWHGIGECGFISMSHLVDNLKEVLDTSEELINSYNKGKMIKEGIKTAIVGKPNVGKSSLLNAFFTEEGFDNSL